MEAIRSSETSGTTLRTTRRHIPEDDTLQGSTAFENKVLRRIFGRKWDEMIGGWRKLHNEELHNLYSPPTVNRIIKPRRVIWVGNVAHIGGKGNTYKVLVGKPEGDY
jgi:hypothetical protein